MMDRCWRTGLLALLPVAAASSVMAASGRPVDIPERIHGAGRVVVAQVTTVTPNWRTNSYGDQLIVSQVALRVEETLKGTPAAAVMLNLEGGTIGTLTLHVSSLPTLSAGERAVFFLDPTSDGSTIPHLKGLGILKLDRNNQVRGSSLSLDDIRRMASSVK
jgi:hypothetical protein